MLTGQCVRASPKACPEALTSVGLQFPEPQRIDSQLRCGSIFDGNPEQGEHAKEHHELGKTNVVHGLLSGMGDDTGNGDDE